MSKKNAVYAILGDQNYYTEVTTEHHAFYVDEPEEDGGGNKAPHPTAFLLGALASCTAITIRMYAQRKGWDVGQIKVVAKKVVEVTEKGNETTIVKQLYFGNPLTEEQTKRLISIGEKCPVSVLLKNETKVVSELVDRLE